jgi:murein DD-endopeptidase MepM/ murein hydrolase activator NlpD
MILLIPVALLSPSAKNESADIYKRVANELDVSYIEMIALDTARLRNDFRDVKDEDILLTGLEFLEMNYKEYEEYEYPEVKYNYKTKKYEKTGKIITNTRVTVAEWYTGAGIKDFIESRGYKFSNSKHLRNFRDLKDSIEDEEFKSLTIKHLDLDYVASNLNLEESDIDYLNQLINSNVIAEKYGELIELPEFIEVTSNGIFAFPTPYINKITCDYGYRNHPITGKYSFHTGIDIANSNGSAAGSPIVSSTSGVVSDISYGSGAYGYFVHVTYDDKQGTIWETRYCHMMQINVYKGQEVLQGTVLGAVGSTGLSTGPHLHFEIHKNGKNVDPANYIY